MYAEIIRRLEEATGADRALDAEIVALINNASVRKYPQSDEFGPQNTWQFWSRDGAHFLGSENRFPVPAYTASVDATITLIERMLPGWAKGFDAGPKTTIAFVDLHDYADRIFGARYTAEAPTPAIAILLALFRALDEKSR